MKALAIAGVSVVLVACASTSKMLATGDAWLERNRGSASVNVTGEWEATQWAWDWMGGGRFHQFGNSVTGAFGAYSVKGVVNGSNVYLIFMEHGRPEQSAYLRKTGNRMGGFISDAVPFDANKQEAITLKRVGS